MATLFISDLHLDPSNPVLIQLALDFLDSTAKQCEELYILGDLFNIWLGDDLIPEEFSPIITQLQKLHHAGIKLYLMVGNRDFMMGKSFADSIGATLLPDAYVINLYGTKTLLLHGDTLCTDDVQYQRYRLWSRNKILQWFFRQMPLKFRQGLANRIKQKSRQHKQNKSAMIMDVNAEEVSRVMTKFGVTQLIHGHTHRPAIHHFDLAGRPAKRGVLGDWQADKTSYLLCDEFTFNLFDPRV